METMQDEVRVQIALRSSSPDALANVVDVPLHAQMSIGDNIAELIPFLRHELEVQGRDYTWLDDPEADWTLRKALHTEELDHEKSLQQAKVVDGTRLLLVKKTPGEKYPPLIDDLAEAIAYWLKQLFPAWGYHISQRVSLTVLAAVNILLALVILRYTAAAQPPILTRAVLAAVCAGPALFLTVLTVVIVRAKKTTYTKVVIPLLVIIYTLTATAAIISVPRPYSFYQIMIAAATLLTLAILLVVITSANTRIHYGVATGSMIIIVVGALNMFFPSPPAIVAAQIVIASATLLMMANRLAMPLAKISLPFVPATGESLVSGLDRPGEYDAGHLAGEGSANEDIFNQKNQVLAWYDAMVGLLAGALSVLVVAGWGIGYYLVNHHWLLFAYVLVIATTLVCRGKRYDDARLQGILLVAGTLFLAAFGAGLFFSPHYSNNLSQAIAAVATLLIASTFAAIWAVQERRIVSPIISRILEIFERLLYLAPWSLLILAMDLAQKVRR